MTPTDRSLLGLAGEQFARTRLEAQGWTFVAANWRCPVGELDLVMRDGDELVFVEVKLRHGERAGRAEESVSPAKARRLLATADRFIAEHPAHQDSIWRIDLLGITLGRQGNVLRISHIRNAILAA